MTILATSFGSPSQFSTHTIIVDTVERAPVCGSRRGQSASFAEPQFWRPWISNTAFGHDAILAVDIGGTNIRAGIVCLNLDDAEDLSKAKIGQFELWRHGDEQPSRQEAVDGLIGMLKRLSKAAKQDKLELVPFIGIGCPGRIDADGSIDAGSQNLPGNWQSSSFNLPAVIHEAIPEINDHDTTIVMHNDAVVQGLSEASSMQ